jgi:7-carboxy-7-deazaguanine synthase
VGNPELSSDLESMVSTVEPTLRVNEVYDRPTVQGEGPHVGKRCTFVRLWGCNLHCAWCDTPYTWDVHGRNGTPYPRSENAQHVPIDTIVAQVRALDVPICVVTGGEPMLQQAGVLELAYRLRAAHIDTHVETNGTMPPPHPGGADSVAHWSVSPKLPSAQAGMHAIKLGVLRQWAEHPRAVFKVVCSTPDDVAEADDLYRHIDARPDARWIMPEGVTGEQVEQSLQRVVDAALARNMNISPRLHVQVWGTQRGR